MAKWHGIRQYTSCCTSPLFSSFAIRRSRSLESVFVPFTNNWSNFRNFIHFISISSGACSGFFHIFACIYLRVHFHRKLNLILSFRNWKINFPTRTSKLKCTHLCDDDKIMWTWVRARVRTYLLLTWQKQHLTNSCHPMALNVKFIILHINPAISLHFPNTANTNTLNNEWQPRVDSKGIRKICYYTCIDSVISFCAWMSTVVEGTEFGWAFSFHQTNH